MKFRKQLSDNVSLKRLKYMFLVLRKMYNKKANMSNPDAFKDAIKLFEKRFAKTRLNRMNSALTSKTGSNSQMNSSMRSFTSRSFMTEGDDYGSYDSEDMEANLKWFEKDPIY